MNELYLIDKRRQKTFEMKYYEIKYQFMKISLEAWAG